MSMRFLQRLRRMVLGVDLDIDVDLDVLIERLNRMASSLDNLTAAVANEGTVIQSAILLIQGLKAKLDEAGTDPQKLNELSTQLKSQADALAAAVAAGTPAAAPVVAPPVETPPVDSTPPSDSSGSP